MTRLVALLVVVLCMGCSNNTGTEKYQSKRDKVENVHQKVKEVAIKDVLIGAVSRLYLIDDYLIITSVPLKIGRYL